MGTFIVLVQGTWAFLTYLFPIPLVLVAVCVWALDVKPREGISRSRLFYLGCLPLFVTPVMLLVFGVVFNCGAGQQVISEYFIYGLLLCHIPLTALLVLKWGDAAFAILAFAALSFYVALCAAAVAGMAVTGDWL